VSTPSQATDAIKTHQVAKTHQAFAHAARFNAKDIKRAVSEVEGVNAKIAVLITQGVGTMACAYLFCLIALVSLPAILIEAGVLHNSDVPKFFTKPGLILIVAWVAQTFIQLVLLSIIMVGQRVQSIASDARAEKTFLDTEEIMDRLDIHTQGGLHDLLVAIQALAPGGAAGVPTASDPAAS
jgi:hypothetical protein